MKKIVNKKFIIILSIIIILVATNSVLIIRNENTSSIVDNMVSFISIAIQVLSAGLIVLQLRDSRKAQEGEFIMNLNMSFVQNDKYSFAYTEFEKGDEAKLSRVEISNYLTFFESIYLLLMDGVISIKILDDLFSYRFFLAVHNPMVQKEKLVDNPYNFRNIYRLEKMWIDYRKKCGLKIYEEKNCLELACIEAGKKDLYDLIINEKNTKKKGIK